MVYDAAVFICVVPVIAFKKSGNVTVSNGHCKYRKIIVVDISTLNLQWCNETFKLVHCAVLKRRNIFLTWLIENGLL